MKYLKNKHEKNSARITALLMLILILLLFFVTSPPYMDPPEEYGVAVNFGNSNVGSGDVQPNEPIKSEDNNSPEPFKEPTKSDPVEEVKPEETKPEAAAQKVEDVLTQETEEALAIKKQKEIADAKAKSESDAKAKAKAEAEKVAKAKAEAAEKKQKEEAAKKAKLDNVHSRILLHSSSYYMDNKGSDLRAMQDYIGHRDPKHTVMYISRLVIVGLKVFGDKRKYEPNTYRLKVTLIKY